MHKGREKTNKPIVSDTTKILKEGAGKEMHRVSKFFF
jgi:hypothetical protein